MTLLDEPTDVNDKQDAAVLEVKAGTIEFGALISTEAVNR
jgi:hypothetical protein